MLAVGDKARKRLREGRRVDSGRASGPEGDRAILLLTRPMSSRAMDPPGAGCPELTAALRTCAEAAAGAGFEAEKCPCCSRAWLGADPPKVGTWRLPLPI
ncbi:hypothetical protein NN561_004564 [Cricetulus griseus]